LRLLILAIAATFRPKALLIAENLCLRQQLVALQRRHPRPCLRNADRRFWILASRWFSDWRNPLLIVKPETVLGWQRAGWRAYWTWRSSRQARGGRPAIRGELQALIGRMAAENRLWGQKRIQAELARVESRRGAVAWAMRQRPVSSPRSSNRTCGSADGSRTRLQVFALEGLRAPGDSFISK
jgi:hypothetical protein